jgi:hypothetical protein
MLQTKISLSCSFHSLAEERFYATNASPSAGFLLAHCKHC